VRRDDSLALPGPARTTLPRRLAALALAAGATLSVATLAATPADAAGTIGSRAVAEASRHAGQPYVYGAAGPRRFDCSGFTKYVYGRLGKALPHNSTQQYTVTRHVAKSSRRPGDLIFMRSSSGRITHVGIYAGRNSWWVAPKSGDHVKLQTLYSTRYSVGRVQ
jgi:peptidoglycan DL-endopeptidase CwlO